MFPPFVATKETTGQKEISSEVRARSVTVIGDWDAETYDMDNDRKLTASTQFVRPFATTLKLAWESSDKSEMKLNHRHQLASKSIRSSISLTLTSFPSDFTANEHLHSEFAMGTIFDTESTSYLNPPEEPQQTHNSLESNYEPVARRSRAQSRASTQHKPKLTSQPPQSSSGDMLHESIINEAPREPQQTYDSLESNYDVLDANYMSHTTAQAPVISQLPLHPSSVSREAAAALLLECWPLCESQGRLPLLVRDRADGQSWAVSFLRAYDHVEHHLITMDPFGALKLNGQDATETTLEALVGRIASSLDKPVHMVAVGGMISTFAPVSITKAPDAQPLYEDVDQSDRTPSVYASFLDTSIYEPVVSRSALSSRLSSVYNPKRSILLSTNHLDFGSAIYESVDNEEPQQTYDTLEASADAMEPIYAYHNSSSQGSSSAHKQSCYDTIVDIE